MITGTGGDRPGRLGVTAALPDRVIADAVQASTCAPSMVAATPWRFVVQRTAGARLVDVLLPRADTPDPVSRRSAVISCGAALWIIDRALRGGGLRPAVVLLQPDHGDVLARIRLVDGEREHGPAAALARADVAALRARPRAEPGWQLVRPDAADLRLLDGAAARSGVELCSVAPAGVGNREPRPAVLDLLDWARADRGGRPGGTQPPLPRTGAFGREPDAAVAVILTPGDSTADWIAAGRALSHLTATASARGLVLDCATAASQRLGGTPGWRRGVTRELGLFAVPQVVLRFGRPAAQEQGVPSAGAESTGGRDQGP